MYVSLPSLYLRTKQPQSEGHKQFPSAIVVSDVLEPTTTPCGICRQVLREFMPLQGVIYVIGSAYEADGLAAADCPPDWISPAATAGGKLGVDAKYVRAFTLEELLPESFGPENLSK